MQKLFTLMLKVFTLRVNINDINMAIYMYIYFISGGLNPGYKR